MWYKVCDCVRVCASITVIQATFFRPADFCQPGEVLPPDAPLWRVELSGRLMRQRHWQEQLARARREAANQGAAAAEEPVIEL